MIDEFVCVQCGAGFEWEDLREEYGFTVTIDGEVWCVECAEDRWDW